MKRQKERKVDPICNPDRRTDLCVDAYVACTSNMLFVSHVEYCFVEWNKPSSLVLMGDTCPALYG